MMKKRFLYIITFFFLFSLAAANAQSVKQLENERKATLKKMETTSKLLTETKKSQQSSLNKLNLLNNNIKERKSLISTINKEVSQLNNEVQKLSLQQKELEKKLQILRADYAKLVQEAYINRNVYNKMMFIFSADTFDQSFRRLRYLQEYAGYRKEQAKEIERVTAELEEKNKTIEQHRLTRLSVLQQKEAETQKLSKDQQSEKKMLTDLQKKEKALRAQLKQHEKKAAELNKKIEQKIAEEIKKDEEKKKKSQPKSQDKGGKTSGVTTLTKEEILLNGNFEKNKGRLPWPVERGVISGKYGIHPHPVLKGVTTNNKGIYIQTPANSEARSVFDGEVTSSFYTPGSNSTIIIRHGNYRTVYANLTEIYVKIGDKVKPKQRVGKIFTDDENENKTELYFQIYKEREVVNPELWIAK